MSVEFKFTACFSISHDEVMPVRVVAVEVRCGVDVEHDPGLESGVIGQQARCVVLAEVQLERTTV